MAQSGWRLPDDLLKRVRVRAAEEGVRQNVWVERALESALSETKGSSQAEQAGPGPVRSPERVRPAAPSRAPATNLQAAPGSSPASSEGHTTFVVASEVLKEPPPAGPLLGFSPEEERAHAEAQRRLAARQLVSKPVPGVRRGSSVALDRQARLNKAREKKAK